MIKVRVTEKQGLRGIGSVKEGERVIKNSLLLDREELILLIKNIQNIFDLMAFLVN